MAEPKLDDQLVKSFEAAHTELIESVRRAISDFRKNAPPDWQRWEAWRTPKPWETRVLPNLEQYERDIRNAQPAWRSGDAMPIARVGANSAGIGKDIDFDMSWMTPENRKRVQHAIAKVAEHAGEAHRRGYAMLERTGRV